MSKALKIKEGMTQLIRVVDEVLRIPDAERAALRASLEKASADIASGSFDVLTPQLLRSEFEVVYFDSKDGAGPARAGPLPSSHATCGPALPAGGKGHARLFSLSAR
jgi:hypothetical protein